MQAVVLAAGEGTRLRPLTIERPKVMLPVARRPVVGHLVRALESAGIRDLVVVVGYKKEKVQAHLGDGDRFGVDIEYVVQERQLGTAHALAQAEDHVDPPFLTVAGDNLTAPADLAAVADVGDHAALLVAEHGEPSGYGTVRIDEGLVADLVEKPDRPQTNLVATGVYRFTPVVFDAIREQADQGRNDLTSVVNALVGRGEKVRAVRAKGPWLDVVYPWDLVQVNARVLDGGTATGGPTGTVSGQVERNVVLKGPVDVGADTTLHPGTVVQGPVSIGEGCEIGPHAVIHPATSIGDNVTVGPHGVVENSVLMDAVHMGPGCTVEDSVLADGVRLGSNVSLLSGPARVVLEEGDGVHRVDRFGAVVGEDARIGSQVAVAPGVLVGARADVGDLARVRENVPDGGRVVT